MEIVINRSPIPPCVL